MLEERPFDKCRQKNDALHLEYAFVSTAVCSKLTERGFGGDVFRLKHTSRSFKAFLFLPRSNCQLKPLAKHLKMPISEKAGYPCASRLFDRHGNLARGHGLWVRVRVECGGRGKGVVFFAVGSCMHAMSASSASGSQRGTGRGWWRGRPYRGGRWRGGRGRGSFSSYGKGTKICSQSSNYLLSELR